MSKQVSVSQVAAKYLEEIRQLDSKALEELIETRVPCNEAVTESKDAIVCVGSRAEDSLGLLGVLNGLLQRLTGGKEMVVAIFSDSSKLIGFKAHVKVTHLELHTCSWCDKRATARRADGTFSCGYGRSSPTRELTGEAEKPPHDSIGAVYTPLDKEQT